jgi:toxin ParE1/3/4
VKNAKVFWSTEALADLEMIYNFLAEKSPEAAKRIVGDMQRRTKQLESFPESGARQETLKNKRKEYRYLVEGNYKIIYSYQMASQMVYIEIIFDTRYNPEKLKI